MIEQPKHDYLLLMAIFILFIAALGAFALHYGGATAAAGNVVYHPCQKIYQEYLDNDCGYSLSPGICVYILDQKERYGC
jgi:hypothetical protein